MSYRGAKQIAVLGALVVSVSCSDDTVAPSAPPSLVRAFIDVYPSWSPDGDAVVYRRAFYSTQGPPGVYLIRPDGTGNRLLLDETPFYEVGIALLNEIRYSPDGESLALALNGEIFIFDLDNSALRQLTYTGAKAFQPDWSPDSQRIVYRRRITSSSDSSGIYMVDVASGVERPVRINHERFLGRQPRWSPQGESIAFHVLVDMDIFVLNLIDGELIRLTNSGSRSFAEAPHWIDHGQRLLYAWRLSSDPGSLETHVVNADGSGHQRWPLTLSLHTLISDAISPNAQWVIVHELPPHSTDSFAVLFLRRLDDAAGTTLRQLTSFRPALHDDHSKSRGSAPSRLPTPGAQ